MFKINPYRPGAGLMPTYLAGRDEDVQNVERMFEAFLRKVSTKEKFMHIYNESAINQQRNYIFHKI